MQLLIHSGHLQSLEYFQLCEWLQMLLNFSNRRLTDEVAVSSNAFLRAYTSFIRAFPVTGPKIWNSLPENVTAAPSLQIFRQRLKTFLFRQSHEAS